MKLTKINLTNFRNYDKLELNFDKNINIFIGNNAQGKTNILESIYVLSITKSHRTIKYLLVIKLMLKTMIFLILANDCPFLPP